MSGQQDTPGLAVDEVSRYLTIGAVVCGDLDLEDGARRVGLTAAELRAELMRAAEDARSPSPHPRISVVLPVYNEIDNLPVVLDRLIATLTPVGAFEIILVDDGSSDGSLALAIERAESDDEVVVLQLSRNFGHQSALLAGLDHARGDAVVLMDSDGQDPPELLPELISKWEEGNHVVYAVRRNRKERWWKRASYAAFYRMLDRLAELHIPQDVGDFCLMDRRVVNALKDLPESSQFIRGLRSWVGFRQVGVEYDRPARLQGEPKYTFRRLVRLAINGLVAFSSAPLRLASYLGILVSLLGLLYLGFALAVRLYAGNVPAGWTSVIAIVLLVGGAQLIVIGVLGSYLARVYDESKRRPAYVIAQRHG
jgi:glycosyltransferase involved in cell wall biosynthesis